VPGFEKNEARFEKIDALFEKNRRLFLRLGFTAEK
jgi:hypothetical protein